MLLVICSPCLILIGICSFINRGRFFVLKKIKEKHRVLKYIHVKSIYYTLYVLVDHHNCNNSQYTHQVAVSEQDRKERTKMEKILDDTQIYKYRVL